MKAETVLEVINALSKEEKERLLKMLNFPPQQIKKLGKSETDERFEWMKRDFRNRLKKIKHF